MERREYEVAGQCRLHRVSRGLLVPYLSDHYYVRVLAQDRPEAPGEVHADKRLDPYLVELFDYHLYRVLYGDYVHLGRGQGLQGRVKGGRLAAPGRPGHEHDPVCPLEERAEQLVLHRREPQPREVLEQDLRVEYPYDYLLAEGRREGRHAKLHLPVPERGLYAPVLRLPLFRYVHPREHLYPRHYRGVDGPGHRMDVVKDPVDPEPHERAFPLRLYVYVAGLLVVGVVEEVLDRVHYVLVGRLQFHRALEPYILLKVAEVGNSSGFLLRRVYRVPEAVELPHQLQDVGLRAQDQLELHLPGRLEVLHAFKVEGVGDGQGYDAALFLYRHYEVPLSKGPGYLGSDGFEVELQGVYLPVRKARLGSDRLGYHVFGKVLFSAWDKELERGYDLGRRYGLGDGLKAPGRVERLMRFAQPCLPGIPLYGELSFIGLRNEPSFSEERGHELDCKGLLFSHQYQRRPAGTGLSGC